MEGESLRDDQPPSEQIRQLMARYALGIDSGDLEAVAHLFEHGRICVGGGRPVASGKEEVHQYLRKHIRLYGGIPGTSHLTMNQLIDVDPSGEFARSTSTFAVLHASDEHPLAVIATGEYVDTYRLGPERRWEYQERQIHIRATNEVERHLV